MNSIHFSPLIVVPVYNAEKAIQNVCLDLSQNLEKKLDVLFIDNRSTDKTVELIKNFKKQNPTLNFRIIQNRRNLGLGGSQKRAFDIGRHEGYSHLIIFHGDGQPSAKDLVRLLSLLNETTCDAILGSRFIRGSVRNNYSIIRTMGNLVFNLIFSLRCKTRVYDIGSGMNAYRLDIFRHLDDLPDDLSFNSFLLIRQINGKENIVWMPISWKNSEAGSSLKMFSIGMKCLSALLKIK